MWKEEVSLTWTQIKLEQFCELSGVDFSSAFRMPLDLCVGQANPYPLYRWLVTENPRITSGVLHLVPLRVDVNPALWEEWFVTEGQIHHHILMNHPHEQATDSWQGDFHDTEHPREVLGFHWHYFNDIDLRPMRYR